MATTPNSLPSAFDAQHPPAADIVDKCVHCGFCLPVCPTYLLWGQEMDSPRGRIYLVKLAGEGAAEINSKWVSHFDKCLGCMACVTACPSGVQYGKLIEATRAQIERNYRRPLFDRLFRWMMFSYHDSCHLQHAQAIRTQPRQLLNAIPRLEILELGESAICCGSAGIFNLIQPETARQLADRKAQNIISTGAQALVSANPGCLLHIAS